MPLVHWVDPSTGRMKITLLVAPADRLELERILPFDLETLPRVERIRAFRLLLRTVGDLGEELEARLARLLPTSALAPSLRTVPITPRDLSSGGTGKFAAEGPPPPGEGPTNLAQPIHQPLRTPDMPSATRGWNEAQVPYVAERNREDLTDKHKLEIDRVLAEVNRHLTAAGIACHPGRFERKHLDYLLTGPWKHRAHPGARGLSQRSRAYNVCLLNGFLKFYDNLTVEKARLRFPRDPIRALDYLRPPERKRLLDSAERLGVLAHLMVSLEMLMGLRRSELLRLTLRDLGREELTVRGKGRLGGKTRYVPWHDEVRRILPEFLEYRRQMAEGHKGTDDGLMVVRKLGDGRLKTWSHDWVDVHVMIPAFTDAGVKRPDNLNHMLRRTYGRRLWDLGVPIERIAHLMGHEDTRTTIRYLGLNRDDARAAMDVLNRADAALRGV